MIGRIGAVRRLTAIGVLLAMAFAAGCLQLRLGDSDAGLVLEDLVSNDSRLRERTQPPVFRTLRMPVGHQRLRADAYVPADGVRAGIVLVPGLAVAGRNDPRLVGLARTLARVGFMVLIPDIPGFRAYRMSAEDVEVLVAAVEICDPDRRTALGLLEPAEFNAAWDGPFLRFAVSWLGTRVISGVRQLLLRTELAADQPRTQLQALLDAERELLRGQDEVRRRCREALVAAGDRCAV